MDTTKKIDALNSLIEINNDRIEGYKTAGDETKEMFLKDLFGQLANTSRRCLEELIAEVYKTGGEPTTSTRTTGKFYRVWMDIKATLTGNDTKAILNSCEFGEDAAIDAYLDVLENKENLDGITILMIEKQLEAIKAGHDRIKALRDSQL